MSEELSVCLHAFVEGRVQGVGFRAFVQDLAQRLGVTGWVRNLGEDRVEVWAEGSQADLDRLWDALLRGPQSSYVAGVRSVPETYKGIYTRFQVISSSW